MRRAAVRRVSRNTTPPRAAAKSRLLRDLPGWPEAAAGALRTRRTVPNLDQAVRAAGLFAAPTSVTRVDVAMVVCLAIGIQAQRASERQLRRAARSNVVDFVRARIARDFRQNAKALIGYEPDDPETWSVLAGPHFFRDAVLVAIDAGTATDGTTPPAAPSLWELPAFVRRAAMATVYIWGATVDQAARAAHEAWSAADERARRKDDPEDWVPEIWKRLPDDQRGGAPVRRSSP